MSIIQYRTISRFTAAALAVTMTLLVPVQFSAQTKITPPKNKYKPADDLEVGRKGAQEVRQQLPIFPQGDEADRYVESVGRRLVEAIPQEFYYREFEYSFDVVNAQDINAFALPGGPMFVNRGMIEAARNEGEMAGVMAHEISHVVLRHGTAQATKASSPGVLAGVLGGAIAGAVIGGGLGQVIAQGTQIGAGAYILKYSREYESQADILGAQIMARAGYDPRDLANMFKTIEAQSGGRAQGPEWLSSHPNPGNRYERINQEAALLRVNSASSRQNVAEFNRIKSRLQGMPQAGTMADIERQRGGGQTGGGQAGGGQTQNTGRIERSVEAPSSRYRNFSGGNLFRVQVPDNWRNYAEQNVITFAPQGAYGNVQGSNVFTHGSQIGVAQAEGRDLRDSTDRFINALLQGNPYLQSQSTYRRVTIDGRGALGRALGGRSPVTGRSESVTIYTTLLRNGTLFYIINVAPDDQYRYYQGAFDNILRSVSISQ
ncbi:MAG TPA: M48 family metallopeptidase [Blastocatellia bacterium]|nr:M48 family metallopeptidase [Blastocatellia bacterium]